MQRYEESIRAVNAKRVSSLQILLVSKLQQSLSTRTLIMVVIGSCLGSGIFLTPNEVAMEIPPAAILPVWFLGGIISLTGAFTYAELGGMFPKAGGIYVYLREAFHPIVAFLYGWSVLTVITSGATAALAIGFATYIGNVVGLSGASQIILAIMAIIVVTVVNLFDVRFADLFTNVITGAKVIGVLALVVIGIWWGEVSFSEYSSTEMPVKSDVNPISALGLALIGVMFSYGGFQHAGYLSAEAKNPKRAIPRAMIFGVLAIMALYLLTNWAYMSLLSYPELMASKAVAADGVASIWPLGGKLIAILVAVSTFGTAGVYTLTAPRIYYAMAEDRSFFPFVAKVHPYYKTPVNAILLQSSWAIVLVVLLGTFNNLLTFTVFVDWIFLFLAAVCLFIFRVKRPNAERPYRTPLYPVLPIVFTVMAAFIVINTMITKPYHSGIGLGLLLVGLPVYYFFQRSAASRPPKSSP